MAKLILRADDLGLSQGVNYGIERSVKEGLISAVGLMVNMPDAEHGFQLIKNDCNCIGLHVNICLGDSITPVDKIPSLIDPKTQQFYRSKKINKRNKDTVNLEECMLEVEAQVERFIEITGKFPDYIDVHAVMSKTLYLTVEHVAMRRKILLGIPALESEGQLLNGVYSLGMRTFNAKGLYKPKNYFNEHLEIIKQKEYSLAIFHPGYIDQPLIEQSSYTLIRPMETEFLCSSWLKNWIEKNNIEVVSFNELK